MTKFELFNTQHTFYNITDLSTVELPDYEICYTHTTSKDKVQNSYPNLACSFDIETTTYNKGDETNEDYIAWMYAWMFCISSPNGYILPILGRTWEEFKKLNDWLAHKFRLNEQNRMAIYCHNLGYEFQFARNFLDVESLFAREKRKPLKVQCNHSLEFRCSWRLSNMSLDKFIQNTPGAIYHKQSGSDFDYAKIRYPDTELTDTELGYMYCDVVGLNEAILHLLKEDTIASIPLTSTGYVRRSCRAAVQANEENYVTFLHKSLTPEQYVLCKTGSRGGNCGVNACYTNLYLYDVFSKDIKSSYPAVMEVKPFPMTAFRSVSPSLSSYDSYHPEYAFLMDVTFFDLKVKNISTVAYLALARCTGCSEPQVANGRIISCSFASMVITDVDFEIIRTHYYYSELVINRLYCAKYDLLNYEFRKSLLDIFTEKCRLESGDPYLYMKSKNRVNSYFGMMLTDICSPEITFDSRKDMPWDKGDIDIDSMLDRYYHSRNSFLSYQDGLWVTAWARYRLQQGIDALSDDIVYCDTDSCKFLNEANLTLFDRLNTEWDKEVYSIKDLDVYPTLNGKQYKLGQWETDGHYSTFITLGAKKYAYRYAESPYNKPAKRNKIEVTVAGLSKSKGSAYLKAHGFESFAIGTVFPPEYSGRTVAHFNDTNTASRITINGHTFLSGSNIAIVPTTYELGVTADYYSYFTSVQ